MLQPLFRDVLWAVIDLTERGVDDMESAAYDLLVTSNPTLTRSQFDEVIEVLVQTDHLRRWRRPTEGALARGALMPTAKGMLQFTVATG
ncbi:MAG: hypothetical protein ACRDZM_00565, partial [Acidimicrobiia bacterium]